MRELICIVCPRGCHLKIDEKTLAVTGNSCQRGADYAVSEITHPTRVITSTVRCTGGAHRRCPVKTDRPIPKERIFQAMELLDGVELKAPLKQGTVICENVLNTGANFITTKDI